MDNAVNKAVISLSGGLDSTCLLLKLLSEGKEVRAYSFYYGQRHSIELKKVKKNIKFLQSKGFPVSHQIIDVEDVFSGNTSSLVSSTGKDIPEGDYREESMKSTVVPLRNVIFSAIIYSKAINWAVETGENVYIVVDPDITGVLLRLNKFYVDNTQMTISNYFVSVGGTTNAEIDLDSVMVMYSNPLMSFTDRAVLNDPTDTYTLYIPKNN